MQVLCHVLYSIQFPGVNDESSIHWPVLFELWSLQLATVDAWQIQTKTNDSGGGVAGSE